MNTITIAAIAALTGLLIVFLVGIIQKRGVVMNESPDMKGKLTLQ